VFVPVAEKLIVAPASTAVGAGVGVDVIGVGEVVVVGTDVEVEAAGAEAVVVGFAAAAGKAVDKEQMLTKETIGTPITALKDRFTIITSCDVYVLINTHRLRVGTEKLLV
jgi:hypothetical protein